MKKTIILFLFSMFCMIVQGQTHIHLFYYSFIETHISLFVSFNV